jgi:hypothetical protein
MRRLVSSILYSTPVRRLLRVSPDLSSFIMVALRVLRRERRNTGGSIEADYCYSVYLRHLVVAAENDPDFAPETVLELGPGDSIGVGLMALLCGANTYLALDALRYANVERSLRVFDDLVELMRRRAPIPHGGPVADVKPTLENHDFPECLLSEERLQRLLSAERLGQIRAAIEGFDQPERADAPVRIRYFAPWNQDTEIGKGAVDLLLSQAVLEHVEEPRTVYAKMGEWCRPGGYISHQIDFQSHGTSLDWNGHWMYSESAWQRVRNPQVYRSINRFPCSAHLGLIEKGGFEVKSLIRSETCSGISRENLDAAWAQISDADLICSGAHVLARKSFA